MNKELLDKELERLHDLAKFEKLNEEDRKKVVDLIVKLVTDISSPELVYLEPNKHFIPFNPTTVTNYPAIYIPMSSETSMPNYQENS